ncbi:lachesin isoform X2, partial [Aphis craccivora]
MKTLNKYLIRKDNLKMPCSGTNFCFQNIDVPKIEISIRTFRVIKVSYYISPYTLFKYINFIDGEVLHITRVSRLHMGAYLCIASNGVPPSISKRVTLKVQFPPMLTISNQLVGGYIGQDIKLECHTEAFPTSINFWTTEKGDMIVSGEKYEAISTDSGYNKYMILKIRKLSPQDFGSYKCVAKNSLGETDGFIKLDREYILKIAVPSRPMVITEEPDDDQKNYDDSDNDVGNGGPSETVFNSLPTDNSSLNSDAVRWSHDGIFGWMKSAGLCWMVSALYKCVLLLLHFLIA